jgi:hypothetical protein
MVVDKTMSFQLRFADRDYQVDDLIFLEEYSGDTGYTGRTQLAKINNIILGDGLEDGYVILNMELRSLAIVDGEKYVTNV